MKKSRFSDAQMIGVLRVSYGLPMLATCKPAR